MTSGQWAILIFFIIFIIIIIVIIIWYFFSGTTVVDRPLGSTCSDTSQCSNGLVCSDNTCLSPIGGSCNVLSDCIGNATACFNGVCTSGLLSGPGGNPPCQNGLTIENGVCVSMANGSCNQDSDCMSSLTCNDNGICVDDNNGLDRPCSDSNPCPRGYDCDNGRCKISCYSCKKCRNSDDCEGDAVCVNGKCRTPCSSESSSSSSSNDKSSSSSSSNDKSSTSSSNDKSSTSNNKRKHHKGCKCSKCNLSTSSSSNIRKRNISSNTSRIPDTFSNQFIYNDDDSSYETIGTKDINSGIYTNDNINESLKSSLFEKMRSVKYRNSTVKFDD